MASHRWWTVMVATIGLIAAGDLAHAGTPDEPVDSPEWTELAAFVSGLQCPDLSPLGLTLAEEQFDLDEEVVDGVRVPREQWAQNVCRYEMGEVGIADGNSVSIEVEVLYAPEFSATGCDDELDVSPDAGSSKHVRLASISDERAMHLEYWISHGVVAAAPAVEASIEQALVGFAGVFSPRTAICQYPPPELTCPELGEWELTAQYDPEPRALPRFECEYSLSAAREAAEAALTEDERAEQYDQLWQTYDGIVEFQLLWATDRTPELWYPRACEDFGESPRPNYAVLGGDGVASQAEWYFSGNSDSPYRDPELFDRVLADLRASVAHQAATCSPEQITSPWSPLPDYLAELFTPERYGTRPIPDELMGTPSADLRVAVATTAPTVTVAPAAPATAPPPTVSPATAPTDPSTPPPTDPTTDPAPETGAGGGDGWMGVLRTVVVVGGLVMSLVALSLAFVLIRRETRVRPTLDVVRVGIVAVTAGVMVAVFSRGAPWWAVGGAIVLGGVLGWFQGRHLVLRSVDGRVMARRGPIAIVVFGIGLVLTQIAGLLNRTGVIAVGIALSFLSGAITAGLIVGRRPHLIEARRLAGAAAAIMVLGGLAVAAPVDLDPVDAQVDEDELVDLVDWTSTEFNGGLFVGDGKPGVVVEVPAGFESPPDPIVRDIEWSEPRYEGDTDPDHFTATETFTFGLNDEGECCAVFYDATGTHTWGDAGTLGRTYTMAGRLDDVDPYGVFASDGGVPFGEMAYDSFEPDAACRRDVATRRGNADDAIATFEVFDHASQSLVEDEPEGLWLSPEFTIDCEVEGFTAEAALAAAETLELAPVDQRASACPANIEIYPALSAGSELQYESVDTVGTLFLEPHLPACVGGGQIGNPLPGRTRSEFGFEFAPPSEQDSELFLQDSTLLAPRPSEVPADFRCELADDGRAATIGPDAPSCQLSTWHLLDDQGSWLSIYTDNNYEDGPDVEVRASLPWGDYSYRCHHCEPHSPEITRWIAAMHDFATGWIDQLPDGTVEEGAADADETGDAPADAASAADAATGPDEPAADVEGTAATAGEPGDDQADAVTLVALLGLLASGGLLATAVAESGHSPAELISTIRDGGYAGLNGLLDLPPDAIVDEYGEVIVADEEGLYHYGDQVGTRDEVEEWIAEGQSAIIERQDELDAIVDEMYSDEAAAERFEQMAVNSAAIREPILDEMRAEQAGIDRLQTILDQRDAALANLQMALADQQLQGSLSSYDQITYAALQGMADDFSQLDDLAVDAVRTVVTEIGSAENWQILGETAAETVYDLAGLAAGNSFGDGAESIANGVRFGGRASAALAQQLATDPVGTVAMFTGISDLAAAMDPNAPLGDRIGSYLMASLDIAGALSGVGAASSADDLIDIARTADAATDAVDTTRDLVHIADAADDATDAVRAGQVADAALDPDLLRHQISEAIASGDEGRIRLLFQNDGMRNLAALEAGGGLSEDLAQELVRWHDEITGNAIREGTLDAIDEFVETTGYRPNQVLVGNSGSTGTRSVLTDADRTLVLTFDDDQLDAWRHYAQEPGGPLPTRLEAQQALQDQFTRIHEDRVAEALNLYDETGVRLSAHDMDTSSYSGFGSLTGKDDLYPAGYTTSRQSIQGTTDVYRVDPSGQVRAPYTVDGQAIVDQSEIVKTRLAEADLRDLEVAVDGAATRPAMTDTQIDALEAYLDDRFSDPTRIELDEMQPLLQQQVHAVEQYDDVKSITKAVDRAQYVASRTGRPLSNAELVEAAIKIRKHPRSADSVLRGLEMSQGEFNELCRQMVIDYGSGS